MGRQGWAVLGLTVHPASTIGDGDQSTGTLCPHPGCLSTSTQTPSPLHTHGGGSAYPEMPHKTHVTLKHPLCVLIPQTRISNLRSL